MITGKLIAQIRLLGFSLRFNYLELRLEWLRPAKDIEARYIEGCSYRNNITVSQARTSFVAISVDV
jgi:hypothetical protein